jgi:hypothetical protein
MTVLDDVLPDYADHEVHETAISAPVDVTWGALRAITPGELPVSRLLMAIRSLPALLARRGALAGRADAPLLDQFLELGFRALVDEPPRSFVAGGIGQPWRLSGGRFVVRETSAEFAAFAEPGFVLMALSLEVVPGEAGGSRLRTETRVKPTDPGAARSFAPYWLVVKPFSALIRRDLLRGIRLRAEATPGRTAAR